MCEDTARHRKQKEESSKFMWKQCKAMKWCSKLRNNSRKKTILAGEAQHCLAGKEMRLHIIKFPVGSSWSHCCWNRLWTWLAQEELPSGLLVTQYASTLIYRQRKLYLLKAEVERSKERGSPCSIRTFYSLSSLHILTFIINSTNWRSNLLLCLCSEGAKRI